MVFVIDIFHSYGSIIYIYIYISTLQCLRGLWNCIITGLCILTWLLLWFEGTLDCFIELSLPALALVIKLYRDFFPE